MRIVSEAPGGSGRAVGCGDAFREAMGKIRSNSRKRLIRITEKRKRGASQGTKESGRGRVLLELLDVALFDLLHQAFALRKVAA
jgi:xanthine/CO dehydrogenase XdhC/CoxF family maturation factor